MNLAVEHIKEGDTFIANDGTPVWTAINKALSAPDADGSPLILVDVQFTADGGCATRVFRPGQSVTVRRDALPFGLDGMDVIA